jgi:hypothetical protein
VICAVFQWPEPNDFRRPVRRYCSRASLVPAAEPPRDAAHHELLLTGYDGYTCSSLTVVGRNEAAVPVRELTVTEYVLWKTASWEGQSVVVELDIFARAAAGLR